MATVHTSALPLMLRKLDLKRELNIGGRTLDRWISAGIFPKADISIGGKTRLWRRESLLSWLEANSTK